MAKRKRSFAGGAAVKKRRVGDDGLTNSAVTASSSETTVADQSVKHEYTVRDGPSEPTETLPSTEMTLLDQSAPQEDAVNAQKQSPFMSLPAEIRVMVYSHLFPRYSLFDGEEQQDKPEKENLAQPSLTRTCRILRNEALASFYNLNEPIIKIWHSKRPMRKGYSAPWLQGMSKPEAAQIRTIVFACRKIKDIEPTADESDIYPSVQRDDVLFRIELLSDEPGFRIGRAIWDPREEYDTDESDVDEDEFTDIDWAVAGFRALRKRMETLVQRPGFNAFDSFTIKWLARLLVNRGRW